MKQYLDALIFSYLEHMRKVGTDDYRYDQMADEVQRLRRIQEQQQTERAA